MRQSSLIIVAVLCSLAPAAIAGGISEEDMAKYAGNGLEVEADDYPPAPADTADKCLFEHCGKPTAEELSTLSGLIQLEEKRAQYLEMKAKRLKSQAALTETDNGVLLPEQVSGLYVSQIFSRDGGLTAKIYYEDRYFLKSNNEKLSSNIVVHKVTPSSVVFNIGGTFKEMGLTPQSYINEQRQQRLSESSNVQVAPELFQPPVLGVSPQ